MAGNDNRSRDISSNSKRNYKKVPKFKPKGTAKRVVAVFLSLIFIFLGSFIIYYYRTLDSFNFDNFSNNKNTDATTDGEAPDLGDGELNTNMDSGLLNDPMVLNVMLFGSDMRADSGEDYGRSDSMILLSIDNRHDKIKLTSFLRDTYVEIPGHGMGKITTAYSYGGPELAIETVEYNFGIKIDRYAVVGFDAFENIVNTLGGIDLELTQDEIDYINHQRAINNQTDTLTEITDPPGMVHLNGSQALWHVRNRGWDYTQYGDPYVFEGDDWDRTDRQRKFLNAVMEDMKSASIPQLIQIVSEIGPMITTNLTKNEITTLVMNALTYLGYDMEETTVPKNYWGYETTSDGQSIIQIYDFDAARKELAVFLYEELVTGGVDINTSSESSDNSEY